MLVDEQRRKKMREERCAFVIRLLDIVMVLSSEVLIRCGDAFAGTFSSSRGKYRLVFFLKQSPVPR